VAKRLEDLFDPTRLGGLWTPAPLERAPDPAAPAPTPPLVLLERRLRAAVVGRFGESRAAATGSLFERLEETLSALSPDEEGTPPDVEAANAARAELEPMLYDLEDLIDALEVSIGAAGTVRGAAAGPGAAGVGDQAGGVGAGAAGAAAGVAIAGAGAAAAIALSGGGDGEGATEGLEGADEGLIDGELAEQGEELVGEGAESVKELLGEADMSSLGFGGGDAGAVGGAGEVPAPAPE